MKAFIFILFSVFLIACDSETKLEESILADYIEIHSELDSADVVACAGGRVEGLLSSASTPTDIFFYPISGASDFRYFEVKSLSDSTDFSKYMAKELASEPIFNGYLWKFNNIPFSGERLGIVTYKTPGKFHMSSPIRLKTNEKPTEVNSGLISVSEEGVNPSFTWMDGTIDENEIYFQVISDSDNNFISGTYTIDKEFTFYDLSNVVFNITDTLSEPSLVPNSAYKFTLMGVSKDNWVNLFAEKEFFSN